MTKKILLIFIIIIAAFLFTKERSFDENKINIASSMPLSGIMKPWGDAVNIATKSYFEYVNDKKLLKDKEINFIVLDDKYEPDLTFENITKILKDHSIFSFFGIVGTPTVKSVVPIFHKENIPFFSPFSGALFLRDENFSNIVNFRASYKQEIENLVDYILNSKKLSKISVFYQNDEYGEEGYISTIQALKKNNISLYSSGSYKRNTLSISHAFNEIKNSNPEVIFMIGSYKANALFIEKAKKDKELQNTIFCTISFADANSIIKELNSNQISSKNIIFSQVVPNYLDTNLPIALEYQEIMNKYSQNGELGFLSFEAFLSSKILVNAISTIDGKITQSKFLNNLKTIPKELLKGIPLKYENSQLLNKTYLFEYDNNEFKEIIR